MFIHELRFEDARHPVDAHQAVPGADDVPDAGFGDESVGFHEAFDLGIEAGAVFQPEFSIFPHGLLDRGQMRDWLLLLEPPYRVEVDALADVGFVGAAGSG